MPNRGETKNDKCEKSNNNIEKTTGRCRFKVAAQTMSIALIT